MSRLNSRLARARFLCPLPYPTAPPSPSPAPLSAPPPRSRGSSPCTRRTRSPPPPAASSPPRGREPPGLRGDHPTFDDASQPERARRTSAAERAPGTSCFVAATTTRGAGGVRMTSSFFACANPFESVRRPPEGSSKGRPPTRSSDASSSAASGTRVASAASTTNTIAVTAGFSRSIASLHRSARSNAPRSPGTSTAVNGTPAARRRSRDVADVGGGRREERRGMMTMLVVVVRAIGGRTRRGPRAVRVRGLGGRPPAHARGRRG